MKKPPDFRRFYFLWIILVFVFRSFSVLLLVVITACEKLLSPMFFFVFEYLIYSSTMCILYTLDTHVNTFLLI